jgi:hypothetical protein
MNTEDKVSKQDQHRDHVCGSHPERSGIVRIVNLGPEHHAKLAALREKIKRAKPR